MKPPDLSGATVPAPDKSGGFMGVSCLLIARTARPDGPPITLRPMLARVHSFVLVGVDAILCEIEADVTQQGMSKSEMVGLAQNAVKESLDRVRRAIINSGFMFAAHGILVNLAPADVRKEGPSLDLPIAIGLLRGTNGVAGDKHKDYLIAGELALDGRVRKIKGALSLAMLARDKKFKGVIVPAENAREAAVVEGVEVIGVESLLETVSFLSDLKEIAPHQLDGAPFAQSQTSSPLDFADVRGQEAVKRALTIAAAGNHNVLMIGPPGTGGPGTFGVPRPKNAFFAA